MGFVIDMFSQTITISIFVIVMMLIIEYVNVVTKGTFSDRLTKHKKSQIVIAALLGVIPGCLGTYTCVSLYTHNILSIGALTATMIATSGDEAFFLLSMDMPNAILMFVFLFIIAIVVGWLVDTFRKCEPQVIADHSIGTMQSEHYFHKSIKPYIHQLRRISFHRAILLFGIIGFAYLLISGSVGHSHLKDNVESHIVHHDEHNHDAHHCHDEHEGFEFNWFNTTLIVSLILLFVIVIHVPDQFLTQQLWEHILKKHFLKISLWTLGALLVINFVLSNITIEDFITTHIWVVLIVALLVGIIPESGPQMIFVTMFVSGTIPLSILMANSIVQDGHGSLPLFAESPKSFIFVKVINVLIGGVIGTLGLLLGF